MPAELSPWPRPHFVPGGGDALVLYRVYGTLDPSRPLSASRYRVGGIPPGVDLVVYNRDAHPDGFFQFLDGVFWDTVRAGDPGLADRVRAARDCVLLMGTVADPPTLDYLRDAVGIVTWQLDAGGVAVLDPQVLKLWSPEVWHAEVFGPAAAGPHRQVVILTSEEVGGTLWLHTRGMRKFGRPDLSVRGVGPAHRAGVIDLFNRFIEFQALGGVVANGQDVRMRSLPSGGVCHHGGDLDDPDFNNVHVEIVWPDGVLA